MADQPSKAGITGRYRENPYNVSVSYGQQETIQGAQGPLAPPTNPASPSSWFGPLTPLLPIAPPEVAGRQFDYLPGYNLTTIRRQDRPGIFEVLRQFADTFDILRLVMETRKDQFCRQQWKISPREDNKKTQAADVAAMTAFFKRPDGFHSFSDWARVLLEDLFVVDAPTLYRQRDRGGKLIALYPLDGATIKPVIDDWGRTPVPYYDGETLITPVAYQQVLKGYPAVDYSTRDLIYRPRNIRATTPYGFSPVEQVFTTVNIGLRRQLFLLDYYTAGNIPDALIGVPETWTPDQISAYQRRWDDYYSGNLESRRKAIFVPGSVSKSYTQTKEPALSGEFDEWLGKIVCFAFSIPPNWFTKQMSNRSGAETTKEAAEEEGLAPILEWAKQLFDDVLEFEFNLPGLEFAWQEEEAIDQQVQSTILIGYVGAGIQTRNEARDILGFDKDPDPSADKLMVTTGAGLMPLDSNTIEGKQANMAAFGTPDGSAPRPEPTAGANGGKNGQSGQKGKQNQSPRGGPGNGKFAKRDVSDEARDAGGRWTSGGGGSAADTDEARERQKAKARERAAASRARAKQRAKESERAKERASPHILTPSQAASETPEQERADLEAILRTTVQGAVLIAGGALVAALAPEAAGLITAAKIGQLASGVGETMLYEAAETTAVHIFVKLGFSPKHVDTIIAGLKEHLFGKAAGAAGDIQAANELKSKLPIAFDTAVEMVLDYVAEHAPDATMAQHNAIADALEEKADEFKDKVAALTAVDVAGAQKFAKAGGRPASPVPFDRLAIREARSALKTLLATTLAKVGKKAATHVRARLQAMGKAEESEERPEDIADGADFSDFEGAVPDIADALSGVASDSARRTLVHLGVGQAPYLVNQVDDGAVATARDRAAEMVGMRWEDGELVPSSNAANTITETTRDMLRETIAAGLEANLGHDVIADNIAESAAFSPERAELIAHTEIGNINSAASLDSAQAAADAGVEALKGWLTAGDDKVEEVCRGNADAGFIDLDDDFPSGDASPLAHPRCRCSVTYQVKEANA